jgi:hypothetical protein
MKCAIFVIALLFALSPLSAQAEQGIAIDGPRAHWTWPANPEPDVRGYGVYLAIGNAGSPYVLMGETPTPEYETDIAWGEVQYMRVDAVDWWGNRSPQNAPSVAAIRDFPGLSAPGQAVPDGTPVEFTVTTTLTATVTP